MFKHKKKKPGGNKTKKQVRESSSSESDAELSNSGSVSEHDELVLPVEETLESVSDHEDDGKDWRKRVDENLQEYITTSGCRSKVSNKYFDNPPHYSLQGRTTMGQS